MLNATGSKHRQANSYHILAVFSFLEIKSIFVKHVSTWETNSWCPLRKWSFQWEIYWCCATLQAPILKEHSLKFIKTNPLKDKWKFKVGKERERKKCLPSIFWAQKEFYLFWALKEKFESMVRIHKRVQSFSSSNRKRQRNEGREGAPTLMCFLDSLKPSASMVTTLLWSSSRPRSMTL